MARVRRVFAGVNGSPGSLQAVRYAADLARALGCELIPVLAWSPPGGDLADRGGPSAYLRQVWKDAAWQRLEYSLELAFGQVPADLRVEPLAVRGDPGAVLVTVANKPDDDRDRGRAPGRPGAAGRLPGQPVLPGARVLPGGRRAAVGTG